MKIKAFSDKILFDSKNDVYRIHTYIKLLEHGIKPFENDIDIILELYFFGGYTNSEEQKKFINLCIEKNYRKSDQSVRNAISKYTILGVFKKTKNTVLHLDEKFIPKIDCDRLVLNHVISHAE